MSPWTIALVVGALMTLLVLVLCLVVLRSLSSLAANAKAVVEALEQVQGNTAALSNLESATGTVKGAAEQLAAGVVDPGEGNSQQRSRR